MTPIRTVALLASAGLLGGCSLIQVKPEAEHVRIYFGEPEAVERCSYRGEVVGSEGHWYNSWLLANADMTNAAIADMRNQAQERGADTIYVPANTLYFKTSVTILGQAYTCRNGAPQPPLAPDRANGD